MAYAGTMGHRRRHRGGGLPGRLVGSRWASPPRASPARRSPTCCGRRRAPISPDAPSLPITIGGVAFNVPPAAIRFKVQRRPGAQARVDLTFVWPSLTPPDLSIKPLPTDTPDVTDRLFVTIAASDSTLSPAERLKAIYPRYADAAPDRRHRRAQPAGLPRRLALPGRGPDPASRRRRSASCSAAPARSRRRPAMCLHERRIGGADVTVRFPRALAGRLAGVADGIDRLIAGFRPTPAPG